MIQYFSVKVPATSANIGPGFDCFGLALRLYNTFVFKSLPTNNALELYSDFVIKGNPKYNLIYRAYEQTIKALGYKYIPGISIHTKSAIPSARGLGSSATAIVAGVLAAGAITNTNMKLSEAIKIATAIEGHPDNVAHAILGDLVISLQDKGWVYTETIKFPDELVAITISPDIKVHTTQSRRVLPTKVSFDDAIYNLRRSALFIGALNNKNWYGVKVALNDKLHQNYRAQLIPGLNKIINVAKYHGAVGATLSGSGPSILVLARKDQPNKIQDIKEHVTNGWAKYKMNVDIHELEIHNRITKVKRLSESAYLDMINK